MVEERNSPFWEPWRPKVGQHVRFRCSTECPMYRPGPDDEDALSIMGRSHRLALQGIECIVKAIMLRDFSLLENQHPYAGHTIAVERIGGLDFFAAVIELEPLDDGSKPC